MRLTYAAYPSLLMGMLLASLNVWADDGECAIVTSKLEMAREKGGGLDVTFSVLGRASLIEGDIESDLGLEYGNLFNSGAGFALEGAILWEVSPTWKMGPYVSFGYDAYGGEIFYDSYGNSLKADDLYTLTFLLGGEAQGDFGAGFYGDVHLALGFANYTGVNGIMTILTIPIGVEIFKGGPAFAFDLGSRLGFNLSTFLFLELGFSLRAQGAPQEGDLNLSPDSPFIAALEFGGGLRF